MDAVTVVVTLGAAALALFPRIPALSAQGRKQARLREDVEVWKGMPEGDTRDALKQAIEAEARDMLAERGRDKYFQNAMVVSGLLVVLGTLALAASDPGNRSGWQATARTMFAELGLLAILFSVLIMVVAVVLMAVRPTVAIWRRVRLLASSAKAWLVARGANAG